MIAMDLKDLNVKYSTSRGLVHACRDVNLEINAQESLGIVGESGSGKSTLALAMLRLLPKNISLVSGKVLYNGVDLLSIDDKTMNSFRWEEISIVFQKSMNSFSPVHKISHQMIDIYRVHQPAAETKLVEKRIFELFDLVNLPDRVFNLYPHELSGGMMQRVAIATSLLHNPRILVMDEATTALDVVTQGQILREIIELEQKMSMARIMITHDISVVATTCKRIAVMYAGSIMEVGEVTNVLVKPQHPYTQALKLSFPAFRGAKSALHGIPGNLVDLSLPIPGCVFANRCKYATEICFLVKPEKTMPDKDWAVMCHHIGATDGTESY